MIMRVVLDTNILIDYVLDREPFSDTASLIMELGYLGELELWMGTSQVSDLIYVMTEGGKASLAEWAKSAMARLLRFIHIYATDEDDFEAVASSAWTDLEDAFVFQTASKTKADAIITRDAKGFRNSSIRTFTGTGLFVFLEQEKGFVYATERI